jgi:YfiH family protein
MSADFIIPDWPGMPARIGALMSTRRGGVSLGPYGDGSGAGGMNLGVHVGDRLQDVEQNRALLQAQVPARPAWLTQVHGATVVDAATVISPVEADASIAASSGVACTIQVADCLPVLFCDAAGRVVGAAHAGWRGLAAGVLENTVARMRAAGAGDILAWLGPAIGPQRFEVGTDVLEAFVARHPENRSAFVPRSADSGKYLADIYVLARAALRRAGVERVSGGGFCTVSDEQRFYSYRRDGATGRMAALIWMR